MGNKSQLKKQIILNVRRNDIRVALRENGELTEFYIERSGIVSSIGNIIKGRIESIREELKASFVDIGENEAGFLPLKDLYASIKNKNKDLINSDIIVQVKKEAYGTKGARLTTFIAIPGRYLVLLPFRSLIGISRNIKNKREKKRLQNFANKILPKDLGFIIRTVAQEKPIKVLKTESVKLLNEWKNIKRKMKSEKAPSVLWKEQELPIKITRDLLDNTVGELVVDSKKAYKKIYDYLSSRKSIFLDRIKYYNESLPIFTHYSIEQEMRKIFRRKIWLKSGGYIIIDKTEAMTIFDVNSGKYKGNKDTEEMIYKTNSEAAFEISRQLRLRDIGGIIIIDFIDMKDKNNERSLIDRFKSYLERDKARFKIANSLSNYGLLEMTRERVRRSISKSFIEPCPYCDGKGHVLTPSYLFSKFTSWIEEKKSILRNTKIRILANPNVANYFETEGREFLEHFCEVNKMHIEVMSGEDQSMESIKIITARKDEILTEEI